MNASSTSPQAQDLPIKQPSSFIVFYNLNSFSKRLTAEGGSSISSLCSVVAQERVAWHVGKRGAWQSQPRPIYLNLNTASSHTSPSYHGVFHGLKQTN